MRLSKFSDKVSSFPRSYLLSDLLVTPTNLIGVEVEVEGVLSNDPVFWREGTDQLLYWEAIEDASLRNGCELRLRGPLFGLDLIKALDALDTTFKEVNVVTSIRTSTHIHYDMAAFGTTKDLLKLLSLAGLFEDVLFRYVGGTRADSIYCLPYSKSRGNFNDISSLGGSPRYLGDALGRYQAINLQSLFKHGTVEFRHAGAYTTRQELLDWINILGSLIKYASESDFDTTKLAVLCSEITPISFLREVFPLHYKELMYQGIESDIIKGARMVDDMIFSGPLKGQEFYKGLDNAEGGLAEKVFKDRLITIDENDYDSYDDDDD